jgi:ankyrin repeat protein
MNNTYKNYNRIFEGNLVDAARAGNLQLVRKLINEKQNVNQYRLQENNQYWTPIYAASIDHDIRIMKALLRAGANPNLPTKPTHTVPIAEVAYVGDVDSVKLLLQFGAKPNIPNKWGMTALHWAAQQGKLEVARMLIQNGANVNARTKNKDTPLHFAIYEDHPKLARLFVLAGANKTGMLNFAIKYRKSNNFLNILDPSRLKARRVVSKWREAVQKSNNKFVKNQMSKQVNKVPVSNKTVNLVTLENFKPGNVGVKVTKRWIRKNGTSAQKEYYLKPSTLQNPQLADKPWINVKGKGNVRSMARLATVMKNPESRLRILRRNLSPVVFTSPK